MRACKNTHRPLVPLCGASLEAQRSQRRTDFSIAVERTAMEMSPLFVFRPLSGKQKYDKTLCVLCGFAVRKNVINDIK